MVYNENSSLHQLRVYKGGFSGGNVQEIAYWSVSSDESGRAKR